MRTREEALRRPRSTCHSFTVHGEHEFPNGKPVSYGGECTFDVVVVHDVGDAI